MPLILVGLAWLAGAGASAHAAIGVSDPSGLLPYTEKFLARKTSAPDASSVGSSATFSELQTCDWGCGESGCSPVCKPSDGLEFTNRVSAVDASAIQIDSDIGQPYSIPLPEWGDSTGSFITGQLERYLAQQGITFGSLEFMKLSKGTKSVLVESEGKAETFPSILISVRHHGNNGTPGFIPIPLDMQLELLQIPNIPAIVSAIDVFRIADLQGGFDPGFVRVFELKSVSRL